jgi:hypothetical protein
MFPEARVTPAMEIPMKMCMMISKGKVNMCFSGMAGSRPTSMEK